MSLFHKACKTDITPRSHLTRQDQLRHMPPLRPPSSLSGAALCTMGLAALAGTVIYATRNPRIPQGIHPITGFDVNRFLGKWYELARIEHHFEQGLQRTQAEYSRMRNGSILVTNRGYDPHHKKWRISQGRAKFALSSDIAALKVSFFGPFYGGYNVVALDDNYQWAMIIGSRLDYFWILSRAPTLPTGVKKLLMQQAQQLGIELSKVAWIHQDGVNPTGSYK